MPNIQPAGSTVKIASGTRFAIVVKKPTKDDLVEIHWTKRIGQSLGRSGKRIVELPYEVTEPIGTFAMAKITVSALPGPGGVVPPGSKFTLSIDDLSTPGVDLVWNDVQLVDIVPYTFSIQFEVV
jgi:hypothetical protein